MKFETNADTLSTEEKAELWERGVLTWKLHPGQLAIEEAYQARKKKFMCLNISRRFGKSFWLTVKALEKLLTCPHPFPRIKLAADTRTSLEEFILPAFWMILADCPFFARGDESQRLVYYKTERKFVFKDNGGELKLLGLDRDPDGGRGNYCDFYGIDEPRNIASATLRYLYSSVITPMTLGRTGASIVFTTTAPEEADHSLVTTFFEKARDEDAYVEFTIDDAPHLTEDEKREALEECLTNEDRLREYYCQIIPNPDRAIVPPEQSNHMVVSSHFDRPAYWSEYCRRYACFDLGTKNDFTAGVFGWWDPLTKKLHIEQELTINGPAMTTSILHTKIRQIEAGLWQELQAHRRPMDNNNPLLLQDLMLEHNLDCYAVRKNLTLHAMVNRLREFMMASRLVVHSRCEKTIGALRYGRWNKHRTEFGRSTLYGHFDHLAAMMYLVGEIEADMPVPDLRDKKPQEDRHLARRNPKPNETPEQIFANILDKVTRRSS